MSMTHASATAHTPSCKGVHTNPDFEKGRTEMKPIVRPDLSTYFKTGMRYDQKRATLFTPPAPSVV